MGTTISSTQRLRLMWNIESSTKAYQKSMEKASSGYKFTECKDDVVNYAKAAKFDNRISQYEVIKANVSTGNDVLNIVSEAERNVQNNIDSIKDLCLQISNETYTTNERNNVLKEIRSRLEYIDYVAFSTSFNDKSLLDGTCDYYQIQIDTKQTRDISGAMIDTHAAALGIDIPDTVTGETWSTDDIADYMLKLDEASNKLIQAQTKAGALSMSLDSALDLAEGMSDTYVESKSVVADADIAQVASEMVQNQVKQQYALNIMVNANRLAADTFSLLYGQ